MSRRTIKILVVEDNSDDLYFINKALNKPCYQCSYFSSGDEAFRYLKDPAEEPDIVLIDNQLPGMNGLEILQQLGDDTQRFGFIFLTIDNSIDTVVEAMKLGALEFIVKSASLKELLPEKIEKVYALHSDRREKLQMEQELQEAKNKYQTLVDAVFDSIILIKDGKVLEVNQTAVEKSGYTYEELLGMDISSILPRDSSLLMGAEHHGGWMNFETVARTKSGQQLNVIINSREAVLNGAKVHISSVRDVTESRILEEKLRQSEKMNAIGQLAGGIAHDFNNQLSPIIGYADMLCHQLENPQFKKFAQNILHSAIRSADLTKKLLSFARKGQIILEPVDINGKLDTLLDSLVSPEKNIHVTRNLDRACKEISGDPNQLEHALRSLLINSVEAMPEGGELSVKTALIQVEKNDPLYQYNHLDAGSYLSITISDTGWGIPEELKKNIFEPFFTTKEVGEGSGMGLASAYGAVVEHDGYITFSSEEGNGTEFSVYLPANPLESSFFVRGEDGEIAEKAKKSHVLIVDDEEMLRQMLEDILEGDNHRISSCASGEEALQIYKERGDSIDLVILDMVMAGMDGYETFMKLREIDSGVKVIVSSGYNMRREFKKMREAGALGIMKKPYKVNQLRKQLKNVLG